LKLFVDSSDPTEVRRCFERQWVEGVATGLSAGDAALAELCACAAGPVSAPVRSAETAAMLDEARALAELGPNVIVRLPVDVAGLKTARACAEQGIAAHLAACDSPEHAVLAAKAGARYVSPAAGAGAAPNELIRSMSAIFRTYRLPAEVLAMPVRTASQVVDAALAGAAVAAVPMPLLEQVIKTGAPAAASSK
jgi:transaldolase